jgi:methyltransferase (TIGR00027 family)
LSAGGDASLGAGLDSFAQRRPDVASHLKVFEVDQPNHQAWKRQRLADLGFVVPDWLRFVPVDFEAGGSWQAGLAAAGFDAGKPAVVVSTGVSMYLTKEANAATLREVGKVAMTITRHQSRMARLGVKVSHDQMLAALAKG